MGYRIVYILLWDEAPWLARGKHYSIEGMNECEPVTEPSARYMQELEGKLTSVSAVWSQRRSYPLLMA
jgi:hypothetical protein